MPSQINKVVASVISAGVLGGMGYGIYALTNTSDNLKNYLLKNELTPIEEDDSEEWSDIFESYKLEKTSETQIQNKEVTSSEEIKSWCISNLNKNISSIEDPLFKKASKWCVEIMNIEKSLGGNQAFEQEVTKLNGKLDSFANGNQEEIKKISAEEGPNKIGAQIKTWCAKNSKRRNSEENNSYSADINKNCLVG